MFISVSVYLEREREESWYKIMLSLVGLFQVKLKAKRRVLSLPGGSQERDRVGTAKTIRTTQ